jgi:hypothetical protein
MSANKTFCKYQTPDLTKTLTFRKIATEWKDALSSEKAKVMVSGMKLNRKIVNALFYIVFEFLT